MNFLKKFSNLFFFLLTATVVVVGCKKSELGNFSDDYLFSITEIVQQDTAYSSFLKIMAVDKTVNGALNGVNPTGSGYTLFLPTNAAIIEYLKTDVVHSSFEDLLLDTSFVASLVRFHVLSADYSTTDFPYSVIEDTTASGDNISISLEEVFSSSDTSTYYIVQKEAVITTPNILARNGTIHVIDKMLTPVVYSSYMALKYKPNYTIFTEGLEKTGLNKLMAQNTIINGNVSRNRYTTFAEPDSMYANNGINNFNDLVTYIYNHDGVTGDIDLSTIDITDKENRVYQYFAYHIAEKSLFTSAMLPAAADSVAATTRSSILNSFGNNGISVWSDGNTIKINRESGSYNYNYNGIDTTFNWITLDVVNSNFVSKNGPIHKLSHLLFPFAPDASTITLQLNDDPSFFRFLTKDGGVSFEQDELSKWELKGTDYLYYYYSKSSEPMKYANAYNYVLLRGSFEVTYTTPKILAGYYSIAMRIHANSTLNASVQFYLDGEKIGSVIDPTSNDNTSATWPFYTYYNLATVRFNKYETHKVTVKSITQGTLRWDFIQFNAYN